MPAASNSNQRPACMKKFLLVPTIVFLLFTASSASWYLSRLHGRATVSHDAVNTPLHAELKQKLDVIAGHAKKYTQLNHFNTAVCFLIDMSIASGKQRFFVYDLKSNRILTTGLVTHGRCNQNWLAERQYSNAIGAGCTSLGKYRVGNAYRGKFGLAYKLFGLDVLTAMHTPGLSCCIQCSACLKRKLIRILFARATDAQRCLPVSWQPWRQ